MSDCYYFGCWNRPGHFLVTPGGASVRDDRRITLFGRGFSTRDGAKFHLDGSLAPRKAKYTGELTCIAWATDERKQSEISYADEYPQGQFLLHVLDNGFTAIQWWDRCQGDARGACNSTFLLEGTHTAEEVLAAGREHFPHVIENLKKHGVELVEVKAQIATAMGAGL